MITSHDVAKRAGVSQATVSRALRDQRGVSAETRSVVRAAARELGYVPVAAGRAIAVPRPRKIGVVSASLTNPFYPALIGPLQEALRRRGLQTVLITDTEEHLLESGLLVDGSLDGVVLTTSSVTSRLPAELSVRGIPFVFANRTADDVDADMCVVDNRRGAAAVADLLVELGHTRIGAIMGPPTSSTGRERAEGFSQRLAELGVPLAARRTTSGPFDARTGWAALETVLRQEASAPTALFCGNDVIALGVLDAAASLQVRVPDDLTVVGFDDIPSASWGHVGLTTVRVELADMARTVADALADRLDDPGVPTTRTVLTPRLVARSTHARALRATDDAPPPRLDSTVAQVLRPWMSALDGIARAVNAGHQRDTVLKSVAKRARELLGFTSCAVMLADREDRLSVAGFDGLDAEYVALVSDDGALQIHPRGTENDSPAARAYREQRTIVVPDTATTTVYGRLRDLAPAQGYRSLLATPLREGRRVTGLLVGYFEGPHRFSATEIELAELLAEQTSVVLHTAGLRTAQQQIIDDLWTANEELRSARQQTEWAETQHRWLMQQLLDDGGLEGLTRAMSEILRASITVEVDGGKVLHHVDVDADGAERLDIPIVLRGRHVGDLRVTRLPDAPTPLQRRAVERFALLVGVELLQRRHVLEVRERLSADLLTDLLRRGGPSAPDAVIERAAALGTDLSLSHRVALIVPEDPSTAPDLAVAVRDAFRDVAALVGAHEGRVVLLLPEAAERDDRSDDAWRAKIEGLLPDQAVAIVGQQAEDVTAYARAFRVACRAAELRSRAGSGVVDLGSLGTLALLLDETPAGTLAAFAGDILGKLAPSGATDPVLVDTLRAWMRSDCSTAATAESLAVHPNTVTNRLRRAADLLDRDLQNFASRMDLQLALTVHDLLGDDR
jgi:LacI family transcriptional regulator